MEIIDKKCYQLSSGACGNKIYGGVYKQFHTFILRQSPQQSSQLHRDHNLHLGPCLHCSKLWAFYMTVILKSNGIWEPGTFPAFIPIYLRWVLLRLCLKYAFTACHDLKELQIWNKAAYDISVSQSVSIKDIGTYRFASFFNSVIYLFLCIPIFITLDE